MKKTIIVMLVLVILSIGMVEGYLGSELVTCGDFDCATPTDFWSNLGTGTCEAKWFIDTNLLTMVCGISGPDVETNSNTSQDISFKTGRIYNVTLDIFIEGNNNVTVYISDNSTFLDSGNVGITSWIAKPTIDGNLTINGQVPDIGGARDNNIIDFISVKEILPVIDEYEWVTQVNKNGVTIHEVEVVVKPNKVTWLIKFIDWLSVKVNNE